MNLPSQMYHYNIINLKHFQKLLKAIKIVTTSFNDSYKF